MGCMSAGSTEAVQKERIQKQRERGWRVNDEPTNPLDKQTDILPLSRRTNGKVNRVDTTAQKQGHSDSALGADPGFLRVSTCDLQCV